MFCLQKLIESNEIFAQEMYKIYTTSFGVILLFVSMKMLCEREASFSINAVFLLYVL